MTVLQWVGPDDLSLFCLCSNLKIPYSYSPTNDPKAHEATSLPDSSTPVHDSTQVLSSASSSYISDYFMVDFFSPPCRVHAGGSLPFAPPTKASV